ncbi:MAG: hypothetical protein AB1609_21560 [Bacillota bacterium]
MAVDLTDLLARAWKLISEAMSGAPPEVQAAALPLVWERIAPADASQPVGPLTGQGPALQRIAIGELINRMGSRAFWETVVAVAYCLEAEGTSPFTPRTIRSGFEKARQKLPKNLSDAIAEAVRRGYLAEAAQPINGRRAYYLTDMGRRFVEDRLSASGDKK